MEIKNNTLIIGLLTLILGLVIGYFVGVSRPVVQVQSDMSSMHGAMNGMTMGLSGKSGDELDKAFLEEMIIHHEGAVEMAETLLKGTKRPELIKLGGDIITAQKGEIQMMKDWRSSWFAQ
ncbi:MAG: DUF305 domain-containing protein [Patescibacteria group bacterium]